MLTTLLAAAALQAGLVEAEPNDLCAQATPASNPTFTTLSGTLDANDVDFWQLQLPAGPWGDPWWIRLDDVPGAEIEVQLRPACGSSVSFLYEEGELIRTQTNPVGGPLHLRLRAASPFQGSVAYSVQVSNQPCSIFTVDRFEPNDSFATATPLEETIGGLEPTIDGGETDVYFTRIPALAEARLSVNPREFSFIGNLTFEVFEASTGTLVASATSTSSATVNFGPRTTDTDLFLRLRADNATQCTPYLIGALIELDPCGRAVDDALEGPDNFGTASPISSGIYPALSVRDVDPDAYAVSIAPGAAVLVQVERTGSPFFLPAPILTLTTFADPANPTFTVEQRAGAGATLERVLANPTSQPIIAQLGVSTSVGCIGYEMRLLDASAGPIGASFCPGFTSTMAPVPVLEAWPGLLAGGGPLALRAAPLPESTAILGGIGTLLVGTGSAAQPGSPLGNCIGGRTTRFAQGLEAIEPGAAAAEFSVDLADSPLGGHVMVGQTFTAQVWFRANLNANEFGVTDAARFTVQ